MTLESSSFHVATCLHHLLPYLVPVCNSALFSLFFHRVLHQRSVLVRWTHRCVPWTSRLLLARVATPPARAPAPRRAVCPYVGHGLKSTLEAPREGLRQGEVRGGGGGGWREAAPSWAPKPNVVPPPNGAALPGSRHQEAVYTQNKEYYKPHQTTTIYARYIAGGGPIKQQ